VFVRKRWILPDSDVTAHAVSLAEELEVHSAFAAILARRGVVTRADAEAFLRPDRSELCDPFLLPDIDAALERLRRAVDSREGIFVCGDYDVDGITSIVLMKRCLESVGCRVDFYIPNRLDEGYGLSDRGVKLARDVGAGLIVTVDSGVTGHEQVSLAREMGLDVIVTDHHEPQETLPDALAVVDPKRKDSRYPYKDLAGVGVAFKVLEALARDYRELAYTVEENLDLVAVGTVADIVPLRSENRILTALGLERLRSTGNAGLAALMDVAKVEPASARAAHIGFALGPRLNAAGRLGDASIGVELLTTDDTALAGRIAQQLDGENRKRRELERQVLEDAERMLAEQIDLVNTRSIVLWSSGWHPGVIGIVASRIAKQHNRPTILLSITDGMAKGSGRSIPGFDLHAALISCRHFLDSFGGHQHAAGVSLAEERLEEFRDCVEKAVSAKLTADDLVAVIDIDGEIRLHNCTFDLVHQLQKLRPFGAGNPEPVFGTRRVKVEDAKTVGNGHLRMRVSQDGRVMDVIGFGMAEAYRELRSEMRDSSFMVSLAYVLEENTWRGETNLQLRLKDVQPEDY